MLANSAVQYKFSKRSFQMTTADPAENHVNWNSFGK